MCFRIDRDATGPRKKVVWKVVELRDDGVVQSLMYTRHRWYPGVFKLRPKAVTSGGVFRRAREGFYVYLNKRDALRRLTYTSADDFVLLKLEVDPNDWIHSEMTWAYESNKPRIATYRRVTVPEDQPEMEWY